MDGTFFPQPDFQVPEKEMGQHAGYDVVAPSWKLTHLVVVHLTFRAIRCVRRAIFPSKSRDVPHSVSLTTFLAGLSGFCFVFFSCLSPAAYGSGKSVRK